jgi:hypothetical protein
MRARSRDGLILVALVCGACDDGGGTPDGVSFVEIRERVLQPSCSFMACHSGASPAGMLGLADDDAHAQLMATSPLTMRARVVPGDADASYVMEKLTETAPEQGEQMPPTAPIDDDRIELVRAWIEGGAPSD